MIRNVRYYNRIVSDIGSSNMNIWKYHLMCFYVNLQRLAEEQKGCIVEPRDGEQKDRSPVYRCIA